MNPELFFKEMDFQLHLNIIFLFFCRFLIFFLLGPIWGKSVTNLQIKILLTVMFSMLSISYLEAADIQFYSEFSKSMMLKIAISEAAYGLLLTFTTSIVFYSAHSAGEIVDIMRGQTIGQLFNPQFDLNSSPFAMFYSQLALVLFWVANGHRFIFSILFKPGGSLKPGSLLFLTDSLSRKDAFVKITSIANEVIATAVAFCLPILVIIFLIDVVLGFANRAAPALQVFFISIPIKIWMAVFMMNMILLLFFKAFKREFHKYADMLLCF